MITKTYKEFTIVGKSQDEYKAIEGWEEFLPDDLPYVAIVLYPAGHFMQWVSSPYGVCASMRGAALAVNEYLYPHEPEYEPFDNSEYRDLYPEEYEPHNTWGANLFY